MDSGAARDNDIRPGRMLATRRHDRRVRAWAARVVYGMGILAILSAFVPRLWAHLSLVRAAIPIVNLESRAATLVMVGAVLFFTGRGLLGGQRLAWAAAVTVLGLHAGLQLAHGINLVTSGIVLAGAVWLLTQMRSFPVLPARRTLGQAVGGLAVVSLASGLGIAAMVVQAVHGDRAIVFAVTRIVALTAIVVDIVIIAAIVWRLLSPRPIAHLSPTAHVQERERARAIIARYGGGTFDYFALRDNKDWFFVGRSVVAYTVRGGVCLVSPDPIGPPDEREPTWTAFSEWVSTQGWSVAVMGAAESWLPLYRACGLRAIYMGDEAIAEAAEFTLEGHRVRSLRHSVKRVERTHYLTIHDPIDIAAHDPQLRRDIEDMIDESRRGEGERGFSMGLGRLFDPHDTGLRLSVARNAQGRVDAVCQWVPASDINGWSLDLMRRRLDGDDLPNGLMEFTIARTLLAMQRSGEGGLCLNFAAFHEVFEGDRTVPLSLVTRPLLDMVNDNAQLQSLAVFNRKFEPRWVRRYAVLDAVEKVPWQVLALVGVEDVNEIPIIGPMATRVAVEPNRPRR